MIPAGALYLLKEAGALLASGATAGAFLGRDSSPPYMPTLPWSRNTLNSPPPLATPPVMTRVGAGLRPPPSAYDSEAWHLSNARNMDEAGSIAPPGISQTRWDAMSPAQQAAVAQELGVRQATITVTPNNPCPPGYINLGGGEFPNQCVPAPGGAPAPAPPIMRAPSGPITMTLAPPYTPPTPAPPMDRGPAPPSNGGSGGGGGGGGDIPWGAVAAGGLVLAFLYLGRKKKRGFRF